MILEFKSPKDIAEYQARLGGRVVGYDSKTLLVISAGEKIDADKLRNDPKLSRIVETNEDWQLGSRKFKQENTVIDLGDGVVFGTDKTIMIAGPCAVESEQQMLDAAAFMKSQGVKLFRAGAYKPRTSAYAFMGAMDAGIPILRKVKEKYGLKIVSEIYDTEHFDKVAGVADIIQIGAKAMYNLAILRRCGQTQKPILVKRAASATVKEWLQVADVIMAGGNPNVILCERGIRTFETKTRFTFDPCSVIYVRKHSHLPILLDPSHAIGYSYGVTDLAVCAAALAPDAMMVEVHPCVNEARCDKSQALTHEQFTDLRAKVEKVCAAVGRSLA